MAEDKDKDQAPKGKRKARVLADCEHYGKKCKPNDVIEADASEIKSLKEAGHVDDSAAAVAYAEKQIAKAKAAANAAKGIEE